LIISYRDTQREMPWVRKAEADLGEDSARIGKDHPLKDREDALYYIEKITSLGGGKASIP